MSKKSRNWCLPRRSSKMARRAAFPNGVPLPHCAKRGHCQCHTTCFDGDVGWEMLSKLEIPKAAKKRLVSQWQNTSVQFPRRAHASCWSEAWGLKEIQIDQIVSLFDSMPFLHFRKPSESPCCVQLPFCSIVKYCHSIVIKLCFTPGEHSPVVSTTATPAWRSVELKICASEHRGGNNRKNSKRMVRYGKIW